MKPGDLIYVSDRYGGGHFTLKEVVKITPKGVRRRDEDSYWRDSTGVYSAIGHTFHACTPETELLVAQVREAMQAIKPFELEHPKNK